MSKVRRDHHKSITIYQIVGKELKRDGSLSNKKRTNRKLWKSKMAPILLERKHAIKKMKLERSINE